MDARSDLIKPPSMAFGEGVDHTAAPGERLSSSSSASSSSSGDPFELDANEADESALRTPEESSDHGKQSLLASEFSEHDIPISSIPPSDHPDRMSPNNGSATQSPPPQVMERVSDDVARPSSYRIPSSVFARTNTNAPMEWSVASNESLFSLHTGNMSFTRDQLFWMGKSGELGLAGDPTIMSAQMMDFSSNQPPTPVTGKSSELIDRSSNQPPVTSKSTELFDCSSDQPPIRKSTELERRNADLEARFGVTETTAAETMLEVIRENDDSAQSKENPSQAKELTSRTSSISRPSDCSGGASVRSFAFPILTGDAKKNDSMGVENEKRKQQPQSPSPKVSSEPNQESQPQTPKPEDTNKSPRPKPTANASQRKWLSCFSCCQFCS